MLTEQGLNPFRYGNPVPSDRFIGRRDTIYFIFSRIHNCESTAVVGDPHIGKSSFLRYIRDSQARLDWFSDPQRYAFIDIDCHLLPRNYEPIDFWCEVLNRIAETFVEERILQQISIARHSVYAPFDLKRLFELLTRSGKRAILLIDEFDVLLHHDNFNTTEFFGALRSFSTLMESLALVTASRLSVAEMNRHCREINPLGSPFFNNLADVRLLPLHPDEIDRLFDQYLDGTGVIFSQDDRAHIIQVTGRHPFLVQMTAALLFDVRIQGKSQDIPWGIVYRLIRDRAGAHFEDTWRHLNIDVRYVLSILAQSELRKQSNSYQVCLEQHDPELHLLTDSELIERTNEPHCATWRGHHWRISARSFAEWIVNNAPATSQDVRDAPQPIERTKLRKILSEHFNEGELRDLCFDLSVEYEVLPGEERASKARELVAHCERSGRLSELREMARQHRPNAPW